LEMPVRESLLHYLLIEIARQISARVVRFRPLIVSLLNAH